MRCGLWCGLVFRVATACEVSQYPGFFSCFDCHESCAECHGPSDYNCLECPSETQAETCGSCWSTSYYCYECTEDSHCLGSEVCSGNTCLLCDSSCATCSGPNSTECTSCEKEMKVNPMCWHGGYLGSCPGVCHQCAENSDCKSGERCASGNCESAGQEGAECWQKSDCDQSTQDMICVGGSFFGYQHSPGTCSLTSCASEAAPCNFHLDCCDNLYCSTNMLAATVGWVTGAKAGSCEAHSYRNETLESLAEASRRLQSASFCEAEADLGKVILKDRNCHKLDRGFGVSCSLTLDFCAFEFVEGNIVTVTFVHRHEFGFSGNGSDLLFRFSAGLDLSPIRVKCGDDDDGDWRSACGLLQMTQELLDDLSLDLGSLFSPDLEGSLTLWPISIKLPSGVNDGELFTIMNVKIMDLDKLSPGSGLPICLTELGKSMRDGLMGQEMKYSDSNLGVLKTGSEDFLGIKLCIHLNMDEIRDSTAPDEFLQFDPVLRLMFFNPANIEIVEGLASMLKSQRGAFSNILGTIVERLSESSLGGELSERLDHGFASLLPSPALELEAPLKDFLPSRPQLHVSTHTHTTGARPHVSYPNHEQFLIMPSISDHLDTPIGSAAGCE